MFVGIVALNIFVSVLLRKFFSTSIPDSYDFGRMLLGILIFWGIAATSYRGGHITVDLIWAAAGPRWKRADRRVRHAGAAVRGRPCRPPCCSTRCAATYVDHVLTYDLNIADLAVLRGGLGRRRVGRGADRHPHLAPGLQVPTRCTTSIPNDTRPTRARKHPT